MIASNLNTFFDMASPATLASLIIDIAESVDPDDAELELQQIARDMLDDNVGEAEAEQWIEAVAKLRIPS